MRTAPDRVGQQYSFFEPRISDYDLIADWDAWSGPFIPLSALGPEETVWSAALIV